MTEREQDVLTVYEAWRLGEQRRWYDARREEYEAAGGQVRRGASALFWLSALLGVLAAVALDLSEALGFANAVVTGLATALAAYNALYAFERNAKVYGDAVSSLDVVATNAPDGGSGAAAVAAWVTQVEEVFDREQGQWGQLTSDVAPPKDEG